VHIILALPKALPDVDKDCCMDLSALGDCKVALPASADAGVSADQTVALRISDNTLL
jgi:hypothetical protein